MDSKKQEQLHYLMSFNGGFLGVYAILNYSARPRQPI